MKRLLRFAARLYPDDWRRRYGTEFEALLDDVTPGWAAVWDVVQGGMKMQVKRSRVAASAAVFGIVGALAAAALAAAAPDRFSSAARLRFDHAPKVAERGHVEVDRPAIFHSAFSRTSLAAIVERHKLYQEERAEGMSLSDAAERMRKDIAVIARRDTSVFELRYRHPDPAIAHRVAQDLMTQLVQHQGPEGVKVDVIDAPERPGSPDGPNRPAIAGFGLGGGAILGALVALVFQRRSRP